MVKVRFPYGISNFKTLVTQGYHYVDRTQLRQYLSHKDISCHADMVGYLLVVVGYEVKLVEKILL